ncbi:hypothetical protein HDU76_001138 [Blyttiomyces sp. JEL0837]|nr:hypothetical protein HDU76_001138 [Blyttiomyces sp. JEL0837]
MSPNEFINSTMAGDTSPYPHGWDELVPNDHYLKITHGIYLLLGGFICTFGLVSHFVKGHLYMSEAMVAVLVGVMIGPLAGRVLDPDHFGSSLNVVTLEFSRVIIAIQCMVCGVDLPGNYLFREWKSVGMLIGPIMIVGWLVSALGVYWILGIDFYNALIISACLAPTDPVLANNIVKGKFAEAHIPLHVRLIISAESGANDGLGTPFLFLAIYLQRISNSGLAVGEWLYKVMLYQIGVSVVIGVVMAYGAKRLLKAAERREWIDKESILSFSISLALLIMGVVSLMGSDDILAVFIAGNVLTWDQWFNERIQHSNFQEVIDALLNLAYFVYLGALIPFAAYGSMAELTVWKLVLLAIWIMLLRRPPWVMMFYKWIPTLKTPLEAWFAAWFGPIGAGAIFYAHIAIEYLGVPEKPLLPIVIFIVLSSIIVHGGSVPFFKMSLSRTSTYATWEQSRRRAREEAEGIPGVATWNGFQSYAIGLFKKRAAAADGGETGGENGDEKFVSAEELRAGGISSPTDGKIIGDYIGKDDFVCDVNHGIDGEWKQADRVDNFVGDKGSIQALQGKVNGGPDEIAMVGMRSGSPVFRSETASSLQSGSVSALRNSEMKLGHKMSVTFGETGSGTANDGGEVQVEVNRESPTSLTSDGTGVF